MKSPEKKKQQTRGQWNINALSSISVQLPSVCQQENSICTNNTDCSLSVSQNKKKLFWFWKYFTEINEKVYADKGKIIIKNQVHGLLLHTSMNGWKLNGELYYQSEQNESNVKRRCDDHLKCLNSVVCLSKEE